MLDVLSGIGPVYDYDDDILGPDDYDIELLSLDEKDNKCIFECRAKYEDFQANYSLEFIFVDDNSIEMLVSGSGNVSFFKIGNMLGLNETCKLFYTGEREPESHQYNDNYPGVLYVPSLKLYLYGAWDKDYTNATKPQHRSRPKQNFIVTNPPLTVDCAL